MILKLIVLAVLICAPSLLLAATLHVYNDQQLQFAAQNARAGDIVEVHPGSYFRGFDVANSGTPNAWIRFRGNNGVVIDGRSRYGGIGISGKRYISIESFTLRNIVGAGILVTGSTTATPAISGTMRIRIVNNTVSNSGDSGIKVTGQLWRRDPAMCNYRCVSHVEVLNNTVEMTNNRMLPGGGWDEAITIANGVEEITVRGNIVRNNVTNLPGRPGYSSSRPAYALGIGGEGIDVKEGARNVWVSENTIYNMEKNAIYIDGGGSTCFYPETFRSNPGTLQNIHVFRNLVDRTGNNGITVTSEGSGSVSGVHIYNNIVRQTSNDGILVYDWELDQKSCQDGMPMSYRLPTFEDIKIFNNTLYNNGRGGIALDHGWSQSVEVHNNLLMGTNPLRRRLVSGLNADAETRNYLGAADFITPFSNNFQLSITTRNLNNVINHAHSLPFATSSYEFAQDYSGSPRLKGRTYDFGAMELR